MAAGLVRYGASDYGDHGIVPKSLHGHSTGVPVLRPHSARDPS
jgi:hypothetical protein